MKRTLTLKRETLSALTTDELASVAGGQILTPVVVTLPINDCITSERTGYSLLECIRVTRDACQTDLC